MLGDGFYTRLYSPIDLAKNTEVYGWKTFTVRTEEKLIKAIEGVKQDISRK